MQFGLMYLFSEYGNVPQAQVFSEFLEEIELAEELGFDAIWLPEHHFSIYGILGDTLTLAAAISQRTKRIKIGTSVVLLPLQHPVRIAEQAALVDMLSDGRLLLGLGRAYQPKEFAGFGIDPAESRERFNEGLEMLLGAFTQDNFSYEGKYWPCNDVTLFPKPVQHPTRRSIWLRCRRLPINWRRKRACRSCAHRVSPASERSRNNGRSTANICAPPGTTRWRSTSRY